LVALNGKPVFASASLKLIQTCISVVSKAFYVNATEIEMHRRTSSEQTVHRRDEADRLRSTKGAAENLSTEAKFSAYCPAIRRVAAAKR